MKTHAHHPLHWNRFFMAMVLFTAAYLVTVNVGHAQVPLSAPADGIQVGENGNVVVNGTIKEAKDNSFVIDSAGKDMKIDLKDVDMDTAAKALFKNNMHVTVVGKMNGDDFGVPVVDAKSVTAVEATPVTTTGGRYAQ